jgi:hypothetical protein
MHTLTRAVLRLGVISTLAAAALCVGPVVDSAAASIIPTYTTVVGSTYLVSSSETATLTATVKFGLLVTPTGTVKFTDTSNGNAVLGTARLQSPCLLWLKQCTAQLVLSGSKLIAGENVIKASYGGDLVSKPSSGSTYLDTPDDAGDDVTCSQYQPCDASGTSPDGTAALNVQAGGSGNPGGESVLISFETDELSCSTPDTGDIGVFDVTDPTVSDFVIMDTFGTDGGNAQAAHPIGPDGRGGHVCFDSPTPFTTASGAPATQQPDGSYQGVLPACVSGEEGITNAPCYDGGSFTPEDSDSLARDASEVPGTYEVDVVVVPGEVSEGTDPKLGP